MIDSHTHIQYGGYKDFENYAMCGVEKIVACTIGLGASSMQTYYDEINRILNIYRNVAKQNAIELYAAVGVHFLYIPSDWRNGLSKLEEYLDMKEVIAVGEVGIDKGTEVEANVFTELVKLAKRKDKPVIMHTPYENRINILRKELEIIKKIDINPELVIVDHFGPDLYDETKKFNVGLTVRPRRLTPEDVYRLLIDHSELADRAMVNSDIINTGPSDSLSVPRTASYLRTKEMSRDIIERVTSLNASKVLKL
jgi:predicted metal-dependent TIM-barrel fold hydrolase